MQYTVRPTEYHRGYCPTICDTMESAEEQLALMRKHTDFDWEIVEELDEDEEELQRIEDEEHVRQYRRYYDDEDDGTLYDDDEDDDYDEDEGVPEYVLETAQCTQAYHEYEKAMEGFKLYCAYYEREGWEMVVKKRAMNSVNINGETVCAMRAVYRKGEVRESVELSVRIECD